MSAWVDNDRVDKIMDHLDLRAERVGDRHLQDRKAPRRRLRASCTCWFFARDRATVLSCGGRTRDISRGGLGFVTDRPMSRGIAALICVGLPDGKLFRVTGETVYCRALRDLWHLVGVEFKRVENESALLAAAMPQMPQAAGQPDVVTEVLSADA